MTYKIFTLQERPDLHTQMSALYKVWEEFMLHDAISSVYWHHLRESFPQYQLAFCDENEKVLARGLCVPLQWDGTLDGLPTNGWDGALEGAVKLLENGATPNASSAIEITIDPEFKGTGLSKLVLEAMRTNVAKMGIPDLLAPVRPNLKHRYPLTPMENYMRWTLPDGAPFDPWLRVHWRAGATFLKVAMPSMIIPGTLAEWESWTGMRFPESGRYIVPGALEPITIDVENDRGEYIEPNVWMHHRTK